MKIWTMRSNGEGRGLLFKKNEVPDMIFNFPYVKQQVYMLYCCLATIRWHQMSPFHVKTGNLWHLHDKICYRKSTQKDETGWNKSWSPVFSNTASEEQWQKERQYCRYCAKIRNIMKIALHWLYSKKWLYLRYLLFTS